MHVVGPQLGLTQPGMTIVCGDSHTSTHGAFGALAFGIGTSEVEHVLATQTLPQARPKTMAVTVNGALPDGVTAKDLVLALIAQIGTGGGQGYIVEYRGPAIEALSMEGRMTVCNMSHRVGRQGRHDRARRDHLRLHRGPPGGAEGRRLGRRRRATGATLVTDDDATFDEEVVLDAATMTPFVTWGTNPGQGVPLGAERPGTRPTSRTRATGSRPRRPWSTWVSRPAPRCATSRSTPSSSAPAPTAASRTCAPRPRSSRAGRSPTAPGCSSYPARSGCGCRPRTRASTRSSRRPAPSGAAPAARCASA